MKIRLNDICGMLLLLLSGQLGLKYINKQHVPYCMCPQMTAYCLFPSEAGHVSQAVPLLVDPPRTPQSQPVSIVCLPPGQLDFPLVSSVSS